LKDIEIILVNDGSTDNCGDIIDEYAKQDERVIVIHKENGGQSSARNMGLDIAKGKYVGFIDSDDWIELDMYEDMYQRIEDTDSDICVCGRTQYSNEYKFKNSLNLDNEVFDFNHYKKQDYIVNRLFYKHTVSTCNKIYKLDLVLKNNIKFKDVTKVGSEDTLFNYSFILISNRICSINKSFYNNLERIGSTTRNYNKGYMLRTANLIKSMDEYSIEINQKDFAKEIIPIFLLYFFQRSISQIKLYSENCYKDLKTELIEASNNKEFMQYVKILSSNRSINKYMKNMGFRSKGIMLIKLEMLMYHLKFYNILTKLILNL
jgi:glycosyltransferase involved in cell wall biosynthesis